MTFQDFQQLCATAVTTGAAVKSAAPVIVGDASASVKAYYGEFNLPLVIFTEKPDNIALRSLVQSVRFSYEATANETVITPVTAGT